jgi:hypothetical protein
VTPVLINKSIRGQDEDGLLPTLLFQRVFIGSADHYVVLIRTKTGSCAGRSAQNDQPCGPVGCKLASNVAVGVRLVLGRSKICGAVQSHKHTRGRYQDFWATRPIHDPRMVETSPIS